MLGIIIIYILYLILFIFAFKRRTGKQKSIFFNMSYIVFLILTNLGLEALFKNKSVDYNIGLSSSKSDKQKSITLYYVKKIKILLCIVLLGNILATAVYLSNHFLFNNQPELVINKPKPGDGKEVYSYIVKSDDIEESVEFDVNETVYTKKEFQKIISRNYDKWLEEIKGQNKSLNNVSSSIVLNNKFLNYPFEVMWFSSDNLIKSNGEISYEKINEDKEIYLKAHITYKEYYVDKKIGVKICLSKMSKSKRLSLEVNRIISSQSKDDSTDVVKLPVSTSVGNVTWYTGNKSKHNLILVLFIIVGIIVYFNDDKKFIKRVEERQNILLMEYPNLLNRLIILIGAGLSISSAWERISVENKKSKNILYQYMNMSIYSMENGMSVNNALEDFAERTGLVQYKKLVSMINMNMKMGYKDLSKDLLISAQESYKDRKSYVKIKGEKAATKLLVPMVILLVVVLMITIIPALLSI